jgi:hypothetical protein
MRHRVEVPQKYIASLEYKSRERLEAFILDYVRTQGIFPPYVWTIHNLGWERVYYIEGDLNPCFVDDEK